MYKPSVGVLVALMISSAIAGVPGTASDHLDSPAVLDGRDVSSTPVTGTPYAVYLSCSSNTSMKMSMCDADDYTSTVQDCIELCRCDCSRNLTCNPYKDSTGTEICSGENVMKTCKGFYWGGACTCGKRNDKGQLSAADRHSLNGPDGPVCK